MESPILHWCTWENTVTCVCIFFTMEFVTYSRIEFSNEGCEVHGVTNSSLVYVGKYCYMCVHILHYGVRDVLSRIDFSSEGCEVHGVTNSSLVYVGKNCYVCVHILHYIFELCTFQFTSLICSSVCMWARTARSVEDETRNGDRNANRNPNRNQETTVLWLFSNFQLKRDLEQ